MITRGHGSLRQSLAGKIYTQKDKDGKEFEKVRLEDFLKSLDLQDRSETMRVLADDADGCMKLSLIIRMLETLQIVEDMPKSNKHLDYRSLDL